MSRTHLSIPTDRRFIDLRGQRFGRIVVIDFHSKVPNESTKWKCKCDCGADAVITTKGLRTQGTRSCGCLQRESKPRLKHGLSKTPMWNIWMGIIQRCNDKNCRAYRLYGARGISICEEWKNDFMAFYNYVKDRPSPAHSIDRIDNDGNYEPGNVRWATRSEQLNNFRRNVQFDFRGRKMTMQTILAETNSTVGYRSAMNRIRQGWSVERAVSVPVRIGNYRRR